MQNEIIYSTKNNIPVTFTTSELVKVMLDPRRFRQKPDDAEAGGISNQLLTHPVKIGLEELSRKVGCNGQSFFPGRCVGGMADANWASQQVFGVDFDKEFSLSQFDDRCNEFGIHPSFVYYTFQHTPEHHRFRAVFVLDHIVHDIRVQQLIVGLFLKLFREADQKCRNPARFFYGGKGIHAKDLEQRVNPQKLFESCMEAIRKRAPGHFKKNYQKFLKELGIDLGMSKFGVFQNDSIQNDLFEGQFGGKPAPSFNIIKEDAQISPKSHWVSGHRLFEISWMNENNSQKNTPNSTCRGSDSDCMEHKKSRRITDRDKKQLLKNCQLMGDFISGRSRVSHNDRMILATNLHQLDRGIAWYKTGLKNFADSNDPYPPGDTGILKSVENYGYHPQGCNSCPYADSCNHQTNLLQQIPRGKSQIQKVGQDAALAPIQESRSKLEMAVGECLKWKDSKGKIHIIESDCGLGKTAYLLQLLPHLDNICLCFPTHALAQEAFKRYGRGDYFLWPEPPELPGDLREKLALNYAIGLSGQQKIYKQALEHDDIKNTPNRRKKIKAYIKAVKNIHDATRIFTTHEKAHHLIAKNNSNISTYVFDEDPLNSILRSSQVKLNDIKKFIEHVAGLQTTDEYQPVLDYLWKMLSLKPNVVRTPDCEGVAPKALYKLIQKASGMLESPVGRLFDCDGMIQGRYANGFKSDSIQCVTQRPLPEDKNVVIMSATPIRVMYEGLFGDRVDFVDLAGTEKKGKIVVHPDYSYSRSSILSQGKKFAAQIVKGVEEHDLAGVITFLDLVEKKGGKDYLVGSSGKVEVLGTFGSVLGLNTLTGKNLGIVGTYRVPESNVRIYAHFAGLLSDGVQLKFDRRTVVRNGFRSSRNCCSDDEKLQELEFSLIEAEIVQAIGRARLLEHDCEVHVWSDHLIRGCEMFRDAG